MSGHLCFLLSIITLFYAVLFGGVKGEGVSILGLKNRHIETSWKLKLEFDFSQLAEGSIQWKSSLHW